ncbi:crotonase/enoyl-CoA hydratase family protein [Candidatus Raskinella chloraquaticus]|uniref:Enoyl-CoA hydratase n=1 Tax=Candidatus Raskinella chloraquaticus TaxID=1951219 RepID=A0A1W9HQG0_9HYPH|nr:MAG: enoyl-CoA hydratase [Proteobacteria bacterium SG_bin8]
MTSISYHAEGGVALMRMDRADKKNALTLAMYSAMARHLEAANNDSALRAVLIAGVPGAFSAGNDLQDFIAASSSGGLGDPVLHFLRALVGCNKPLVAAVDGVAVGVGVTMLLHCDYVVASQRSTFATPFVDLGLVPEAASSLLGPRLLGPQRAFELFALGRRWDARKALSAGLINDMIEDEGTEARAIEVAREITAKPPNAMAITKRLLRSDRDEVLARIDEEAEHFKACLRGPEAMQAFTAFMTRKK